MSADKISPDSQSLVIDLIVQMPESDEKEMIAGLRIDTDGKGDLLLASVFKALSQLGLNVQNTACSYKNMKENMFIMVNRQNMA